MMQPLLDALRDAGIPVQSLGLAWQAWLLSTQKVVSATDPDHMADLLALEDLRGAFQHVYGQHPKDWEPDYEELGQEEERQKADEDE